MPLRIAIIEDEPATARHLKFLLQELEPDVDVMAMLTSVADAVPWLKRYQNGCDLAFMDIRLEDGLSFEITEKMSLQVPVVFVTAYNDHALQAFKTNGIDYILKPFDEADLRQALDKFKMLQKPPAAATAPLQWQQLADAPKALPTAAYKQSFLVHFRDRLIPLAVSQIAWFHTINETVHAQTIDQKKYIIDFTLEQLQVQLDPRLFYRANRQFIVQRKAITEIEFYFNGRLLVKTVPPAPEHIIISKARVPEFKGWMNE